MDGEFTGFNSDNRSAEVGFDAVGFIVRDKNGDFFHECFAKKAQWGDFLLNLKDYTRIRIIGNVGCFYDDVRSGQLFLRVDSIEVIK